MKLPHCRRAELTFQLTRPAPVQRLILFSESCILRTSSLRSKTSLKPCLGRLQSKLVRKAGARGWPFVMHPQIDWMGHSCLDEWYKSGHMFSRLSWSCVHRLSPENWIKFSVRTTCTRDGTHANMGTQSRLYSRRKGIEIGFDYAVSGSLLATWISQEPIQISVCEPWLLKLQLASSARFRLMARKVKVPWLNSAFVLVLHVLPRGRFGGFDFASLGFWRLNKVRTNKSWSARAGWQLLCSNEYHWVGLRPRRGGLVHLAESGWAGEKPVPQKLETTTLF